MTQPEPTDVPLETRVEQELAQLRVEAHAAQERAKALKTLASMLKPLANPKTYADLSKAPAQLSKVEVKVLARVDTADRGRSVVELVRAALADRQRRIREGLARELKAACDARGLTFRVIQRDDPVELRLPPFGVTIDREQGRAVLKFARLPLVTCAADAREIVQARDRALAELGGAFEPAAFFDACLRAWLAARAVASDLSQERVEILDFLPYLALQFQRSAFRVEPTRRNYRDYSRVRFAWDVLQLRRAGMLTHGGWRLNLGVATGATASKKNRVIWFEDEDGEGEYKLTVFFTRAEAKE